MCSFLRFSDIGPTHLSDAWPLGQIDAIEPYQSPTVADDGLSCMTAS